MRLIIRFTLLLGLIFSSLLIAHPSGVEAVRTSNIAIRTIENGYPVFDVCYVLVGYSNVGCDENQDGVVTFRDIPLGTYTLRETAHLGPGRFVADRTIDVTGAASSDGWEYIDVTITGGAGGPPVSGGSVDISLITRNPGGVLLRDPCYVLVGYSNIGCDDNADGQVTFAAIPFGTYTVRQTRVPAGYSAINDFQIDVFPTSIPIGFIVKQAPQQNTPGTRNVSIMLIDATTNTKVPLAGACVQLVNASNIGCDQDLIDGQIDFLDVPAGVHTIVVTSLPPGWVLANSDTISISIDAQNDPANVFAHVYLKQQ